MPGEIRTAVAAVASPHLQLQLLNGLSEAGIQLLGAARDGIQALRLTETLRPDLLLADAGLPGLDGCALARRVLNGFHLPVRPAVLILGRFPLPDQAMLPRGAVFAQMNGDPNAFLHALNLLCSSAPFSPEEMLRADQLLLRLGVPDHLGRRCLQHAALICAADVRCLHDMQGRLFPRVGEMCACTARQAQRAMRHVIERAWQSDQFDNQYRIFADTVDARRGQPTLSEMISRMADILRMEG